MYFLYLIIKRDIFISLLYLFYITFFIPLTVLHLFFYISVLYVFYIFMSSQAVLYLPGMLNRPSSPFQGGERVVSIGPAHLLW